MVLVGIAIEDDFPDLLLFRFRRNHRSQFLRTVHRELALHIFERGRCERTACIVINDLYIDVRERSVDGEAWACKRAADAGADATLATDPTLELFREHGMREKEK